MIGGCGLGERSSVWIVRLEFVAVWYSCDGRLWFPVKSPPNWIRRRLWTTEGVEENWFQLPQLLQLLMVVVIEIPLLIHDCCRYGREAYADPYALGHSVGPVPGGYGVRRNGRRRTGSTKRILKKETFRNEKEEETNKTQSLLNEFHKFAFPFLPPTQLYIGPFLPY